jgi:hypothetical protein
MDRRIVGILAAGVVAASAWRLQFGADFTDEAFYIALPYRFALGDRPFIDELSPLQPSALLLTPFVKAWAAMRGSEAIMLFGRVLHLLLRIATALAVANTARRLLGWPAAIAASLLAVAFVPFNLPNVSYNTLAASCFCAGAFLVFDRDAGGRWRWTDVAGGVFHGAAVTAYFPLAPAVALFTVLMLVQRRGERGSFALRYLPAAALLPAIVTAIGVHAGVEHVQRTFAYLASTVDPLSRALPAVHAMLALAPPPLLTIATVALLVAAARHAVLRPWLPLVVVVAWWNEFGALYASLGLVAWLAFFGAALLPAIRDDAKARALMMTVWVASIGAGATSTIASSNAYVNFGIGGFAAAQTTVILLMLVASRAPAAAAGRAAAFAVAALACLIPTVQQYRPGSGYREADIPQLTVRVRSGPFAGLRTTPEKRAFLDQIDRDLDRIAIGHRTLLIYYDFPPGYFMTSLRPLAGSTWMIPQLEPGLRPTTALYQRLHAWPDVVVRMRRIPFWPGRPHLIDYPPGFPFDAELARRYRPAGSREEYEMFVRR